MSCPLIEGRCNAKQPASIRGHVTGRPKHIRCSTNNESSHEGLFVVDELDIEDIHVDRRHGGPIQLGEFSVPYWGHDDQIDVRADRFWAHRVSMDGARALADLICRDLGLPASISSSMRRLSRYWRKSAHIRIFSISLSRRQRMIGTSSRTMGLRRRSFSMLC